MLETVKLQNFPFEFISISKTQYFLRIHKNVRCVENMQWFSHRPDFASFPTHEIDTVIRIESKRFPVSDHFFDRFT